MKFVIPSDVEGRFLSGVEGRFDSSLRDSLTMTVFRNLNLLFLAALILTSQILFAQSGGSHPDDRILFRGLSGVTIGVVQQSWSLKDSVGRKKNLSQLSAPVSATVPLTNRLLLSVSNVPVTVKQADASQSAFGDTRIAASYVLPGDKIWLNGGLSLPTGKTALQTDKAALASLISLAPLGCRVAVLGQGTNVNIGFAYGYAAARRFIIGVGGSYLRKGAYTPFFSNGRGDSYDPGDEISVNAGCDFTAADRQSRISADLTMTNYTADRLEGEKLIQSGMRFMLIVGYNIKWKETSHTIQLRTRVRTQSELFSTTTSIKYKNSQHYEFSYMPAIPLSKTMMLNGNVELKDYTGDQIPLGNTIYETGKAVIVSAGVDVSLLLSDMFSCMAGAKIGAGDVTMDNVVYSAYGTEIALGVKMQF